MVALMIPFLNLIGSVLKSKSGLEAENAALRHQLTVLQCIEDKFENMGAQMRTQERAAAAR